MDFDAWHAQLDPRVIDGWMAYAQVEPFGDEWRQAGTAAAAAHNAVAAFATAQGVAINQRAPEDFMPVRREREELPPGFVPITEATAQQVGTAFRRAP